MNRFNDLTDDQLVQSYAKGCNEAFDVLLNRYDATVHTYIRFSIQDTDAAEDIFQDTFIKVLTTIKRGRYNAEGKFKAWLLRIAHNLVMDYFRKTGSEARYEQPHSEEYDSPFARIASDQPNREEEMTKEDLLNELYRNITKLPMEQREVVMLRYWEDMSFKEIADATGVSINTALGRMRYALINLRRFSLQ
ncbi:RNA polymerase sigma factor [Porphyromonas pogonae]|uniref:RNA polymerase sigma factor n=1 Tax=Porphyromonas pogonae TaxID=867595 RepID=UPI002E776E20|nr:sigma-70 family RNA polymerase sigma factor [Porphyromonas pogonae]